MNFTKEICVNRSRSENKHVFDLLQLSKINSYLRLVLLLWWLILSGQSHAVQAWSGMSQVKENVQTTNGEVNKKSTNDDEEIIPDIPNERSLSGNVDSQSVIKKRFKWCKISPMEDDPVKKEELQIKIKEEILSLYHNCPTCYAEIQRVVINYRTWIKNWLIVNKLLLKHLFLDNDWKISDSDISSCVSKIQKSIGSPETNWEAWPKFIFWLFWDTLEEVEYLLRKEILLFLQINHLNRIKKEEVEAVKVSMSIDIFLARIANLEEEEEGDFNFEREKLEDLKNNIQSSFPVNKWSKSEPSRPNFDNLNVNSKPSSWENGSWEQVKGSEDKSDTSKKDNVKPKAASKKERVLSPEEAEEMANLTKTINYVWYGGQLWVIMYWAVWIGSLFRKKRPYKKDEILLN